VNGFDYHPAVVMVDILRGQEWPGGPDIAEDFHEASSLYRKSIAPPTSGPAAALYNDGYDPSTVGEFSAARGTPAIALPTPVPPEANLVDCLRARHSFRDFVGAPGRLQDLSSVLHWSAGLKAEADPSSAPNGRFVPSAGGLFPLDLYVLVTRCEGLAPGVYLYDPYRQVLERRPECDAALVAENTSEPELLERAAFTVVIAATIWRSRAKYGVRAYRYVLMEAGHVAQNLTLVGGALGLRSLAWNGFFDRSFNESLGLDGTDELALYLVTFGGIDD